MSGEWASHEPEGEPRQVQEFQRVVTKEAEPSTAKDAQRGRHEFRWGRMSRPAQNPQNSAQNSALCCCDSGMFQQLQGSSKLGKFWIKS
ncbi:hypothetical protein L1987_08303 [Smallanthus sonchifolius]|uniref:Uncharacterized protein n=1 Tax=Smallanthus sonchifolius TaxID=185202 RepID=A0ACB9JKD1_9ASTR|nr:hypothetical protein L1987_08303 [Smallanthus sonchifolius]